MLYEIFLFAFSALPLFCLDDRKAIRPVKSTARKVFLAHHNSMAAACRDAPFRPEGKAPMHMSVFLTYLGTNQKGVCDFLLVINSNFGPIFHRF